MKTVDVANISRRMLKDEFNKTFKVSGIKLENNEIKHIIKVIRSVENRGISPEGGFLNFLRLLVTAALPLMKNVLTPLSTSFWYP